jgi:hypothetical protein
MLRSDLVARELLNSLLGTIISSVRVRLVGTCRELTRRPKPPCRPSAKRRDQYEAQRRGKDP